MNSRNARRRVAAVDRSARSVCEQLEGRTLLSTIVWTNRVVSDNFAIYGANAGTARAIVDRAIDDWERVIVNFNYAGGGNTYNVDISAGAISGRGVTQNITRNDAIQKKPTSADITMDDNGGGGGWYFDPVIGTSTVPDDGEFNTNLSPFEGDAGGVGNDFYRTIVHELGHAMGILNSTGFFRIGDFLTNGGADPNNGAETLRLLDFNGDNVTDYTLTTDGGGHMFEGGGAYAGPTHPNDLMNDGRTVATGDTIRQLITDDNATLLRDVYGYTIALPSTINTFYVNLNTTTNQIVINGDINSNGSDVDVIDLELTGVNSGDFRGEVNGASEIVPNAEYTSIVVNAGLDNDDIDVDELESGKSVTVNGGDGNDNINIAQEFDDIDTNLGSNVTVTGGIGTDTIVLSDGADGIGSDTYEINQSTFVKAGGTAIERVIAYSGMEQFTLTGGPNAGSYSVLTTFSTVNYSITGGAANDTFDIGAGDATFNVDADVTVNGGGGTDSLTYNDSTRATATSYSIGTGSILTTGGLGSLAFSALEDVTLNTGTAGDQAQMGGVLSTVTFRLNTGGGADEVELGQDLDTTFTGVFIGNGGAGTDSLTLTDSSDALDDSYTITGSSLQKSPLAINVSYALFEDITLNANPDNNTINFSGVSSTQTLRLNGLGGDDTFVNTILDLNTQINGSVIIAGGAGTGDAVTLDDSNDLTADAYTITSNSFQVTAGVLSGVITYSSVEAFNFTGNSQPTAINVNSALSTVNYVLNGGDGNDTFNFGAGDFDNNIDSTVAVSGGGGTDRVVIDDTADTLDDTYNLNSTSFSKNTGTGGVSWGGLLLGTVAIEEFVLNASEANNTINVNGLGGFILQPFPNPPIDVPINATLNGNGGNDTINLATGGSLGSVRGDVQVAGGAGSDSLLVNDASDSTADSFVITNSTMTNSNWGYTLTYTNTFEQFTLEGGTGANTVTVNSTFGGTTYQLNGNAAADTFDIVGNNAVIYIEGGAGLDNVAINSDAVGSASARFNTNQDLQSLNISTGGTMLLETGKRLIDTVSATINGRLNLTDGGFIDRGPANEATYRTLLTSGYAGGTWNGPQASIISSTASGAATNDALGYGTAAATGLANFFGSAVAGTDLLIRYTLYGDNNLDGTVGLGDFANLAANFNVAGTNWVRGNYNYDLATDIGDFSLLASNYNLSVPGDVPARSAPLSLFSNKQIADEPTARSVLSA